jgi:hypothetical protein
MAKRRKTPVSRTSRKRGNHSTVKEWGLALLVALVVLLSVRLLFFDGAIVRDSQMQNTIKSGKFVLVSKLIPGPRLPITLLSLKRPLDSAGNFTGYRFTLKLPPLRLRNKLTDAEKGRVFYFNEPDENDSIPIDKKFTSIGRMAAIPGETISATGGMLLVNHVVIPYPTSAIFFYHLKVKNNPLPIIQSARITEAKMGKKGSVELFATKEQSALLKKQAKVVSVSHEGVTTHHDFMHLLSTYTNGFRLPKKGEVISLNNPDSAAYLLLIQNYENAAAEQHTDGIYLNGRRITTYKFSYGYCFILKDNVDNSIDSRSYGPIPDIYLIGKVIGK